MIKFKNVRIVFILLAVFLVGINITTTTYAKRSIKEKEKTRDSNRKLEGLKQPSVYVIEDECIYYVSLNDWGIYSIDLGSGTRKQIYPGRVCEEGILVLKDHIYFKNKYDSKLYTIEKNDTVPVKVSDIKLGREYQGFLSINDEVIYYDLNNRPFAIENANVDIIKNKFYSEIDLSSKYSNGILYSSSYGRLISCSMRDKKIVKLVDSDIYRIVFVDDEYIYYIDNNDYRLYKKFIHGKENTLVMEDRVVSLGVDFDFANVEFQGNYIYYISYEELGKSSLCRFSITKNEKEKLKDNVIDFRLSQKGIYYISSDGGKKLHFFDSVLLNDTIIDSGAAAYLAGVQNDYLVYSAEDDDCFEIYGQLFITDSRGKKIKLK